MCSEDLTAELVLYQPVSSKTVGEILIDFLISYVDGNALLFGVAVGGAYMLYGL